MMGNAVTSMHLCAQCAAQAGYLPTEGEGPPDLSVIVSKLTGKALVSAVAETADEAAADAEPVSSLACPDCGLTEKEFRAEGRLGCARCYPAFESILTPLLADMHRGPVHVGRVPIVSGPAVAEYGLDVVTLRRELEHAVALEAYEQAAALRDQITRLVQAKEQS
ncbi:MAG: hypothetical protein A3K19_15535 [Lentisphaerae bacterium RIFOXYB12_FULL_65_16]|nr:MAG: hypothetical protein A3K18_26410 [Lentisphaerae bacterium RIFOXYA12_64_32]OGV88509.1 MAG: hypothetical protein A3K19_15535 [Lentisphaerae bacterium RIFOXYB12_FULL_65_16]